MRFIIICLLLGIVLSCSNCTEKSKTTLQEEEIKVLYVSETDTFALSPQDTLTQETIILDVNSTAQPVNTIVENMDEYYWYVYPQQDELSISSIETLKKEDIVEGVIHLNTIPNVLEIKYKYDDLPLQQAENNEIKIKFENIEEPVSQRKTVVVEVVLTNKKRRKNTITLGFYPSALYKLSGLSSPSYLIIHESDIAVQRSQVQDWILVNDSESEKQFAEETWGKRIRKNNYSYPYQKAQALAKLIINELEQRKGIPSDTMAGLHPFQQYNRAINGKDAVWCANISYIFTNAANALEIPARFIQLGNVSTDNSEINLGFAEGHAITEIYDKHLKKWVLIDLALFMLEASLNNVPLSAMEFYYLANNSAFKDQIRIKEYNYKKRSVATQYLQQSVALPSIKNYYNKNQKFSFSHK